MESRRSDVQGPSPFRCWFGELPDRVFRRVPRLGCPRSDRSLVRTWNVGAAQHLCASSVGNRFGWYGSTPSLLRVLLSHQPSNSPPSGNVEPGGPAEL